MTSIVLELRHPDEEVSPFAVRGGFGVCQAGELGVDDRVVTTFKRKKYDGLHAADPVPRQGGGLRKGVEDGVLFHARRRELRAREEKAR